MNVNGTQFETANEIANNGMLMIDNGIIRNHKLGNSAQIHFGEVEKKEYQTYRDFLPGKNAYMVYNLAGSNDYE